MSIFETTGPALTGIASGIRDAAQTQQTQTNVALSQEGLKAAQEEAKERARLNAPVVLADAYKATPITPFAKPIIDQELAKQGYDPNAAEVPTHAWMKAQQAIASNPDIQMGIFTSYKADVDAKATPYKNDIDNATKAIKELEIQRAANRDSTTPESGLANEKIDKQIEKQKQIIAEANGRLQPFMEQRAQADAQIANVQRIMEIQQVGKMDAKQRQVYEAYKNDPKYVGLSPLALVQKAGEEISAQNKSTSGDHYTLVNDKTGEIKSIRLASGETIPKGWSIQKEGYKHAVPTSRSRDTREPVGWDPEQNTLVYTQRPKVNGKPVKAPKDLKVMPLAEKAMNPNESEAISTSISYLDNIQDIKSKVRDKWVGVVQGNVANVKNLFINDPDFADFKQNVSQLVTQAYELSGKAITDTERKILAEMQAQVTNPDKNFMARLDALQTMVDRKLRYRIRSLDTGGFIISDDMEPFLTKSSAMTDRSQQSAPAKTGNDDMSQFWNQ